MIGPLGPLYAILDVESAAARGLEPVAVARAWLDAGVRMVQVRAKLLPFGPALELADRLVALGQPYGAAIVVNDRADVARLSGAAGAHVGQQDLSVAEVRAILGPEAIVGLSTHSAGQAEAACRERVSYVAIGPVFPTSSKARPDPPVGLEGVRTAAELGRAAGKPVVAIGGITLERAGDVLAAGATAVAVIADLLADDPGARARAWLAALAHAP